MTIYDKEANVEKMYDEFGSILAYVENAVDDEQICDVEKGLLHKLHRLGLSLLKHFVEMSGTGYHEDSRICTTDHQPLEYKGTPEVCYLSIFGEFKIKRASYASKSNEYFYPLDEQLNLPEQKYSYLLGKWLLSRSSENNYREAARVFNEMFEFDFHPSMPERICKNVARSVDAFYQQDEAPKPKTEGSHLAISADGKGVPILKTERPESQPKTQTPKARRAKGEKPGIKKQSTVTVDFSFDPGARDPEEIVKALMNEYTQDDREQAKMARIKRRQADESEPRVARNKHIRATLAGKDKAMNYLMERIAKRDPAGEKKIIALIDGDWGLEDALDRAVKNHNLEDRLDAVILDIIHASDYVWEVGTALHGEKSEQRVVWVREKLLAILQGKVGRVIGGLKQMITKNNLKRSQNNALQKAITYFDNHQHMMDYASYLAEGYPISTGLVEAACGSLVKDRMEQSGMRWSIHGSQAVLDLRAVKKNDDWERFWQFYIASEENRLYSDNYTRVKRKAA